MHKMNEQEQLKHHERMRSAKTDEENEQFRLEHHELIQERAKAQGLSLLDTLPSQGGGKG